MLKIVPTFKDKIVLDAGCGNGYIARQFIAAGAKQVILADRTEYFLPYVEALSDGIEQIKFIVQDLTKPWALHSSSIDLVYCSMVLNQLDDLASVQREAFRVLKEHGEYIFAVTHPALDLCGHISDKQGLQSQYSRTGGYFERYSCEYLMRSDASSYPAFPVPHFHRTIEDYFNTTIDAGFVIVRILEPPMNDSAKQACPRLSQYDDRRQV